MVTKLHSEPVSPLQLLKQKDFSLLLFGQLISAFGDKIHYVALGVWVFRLTGSPLAVGKMTLAGLLPYLLFGLVAGAYVDRWNKKFTMVISDLLRASLVFLIPWALLFNLNAVYVITFLVTTVSLFFNPAKMAIIPSLFTRDQILGATSLAEAVENVTEVLGYAVAGIIASLINLKLIFYLDGITFIFSAVCIFAMQINLAHPKSREPQGKLLTEIREGLSFVSSTPSLKVTLTLYCLALMIFSGFSPLVVVYALQSLQSSTAGLGILESSQALGITLGGILLSFLGAKLSKGKLMTLGYFISGLTITLLGFFPSYPLALVGFLFAGISNAMFLIPVVSVFQEVTPEKMRGRVFSARFTSTRLAFMFSVICLTYLANLVGVNMIYISIGIALTTLALASFSLKTLKTL
ncbi:MAG TPA: MFS transporter [Candidatus Deferrimicrobium sp.]|nr:MFS transporter [Candidatus Deferrimicrobium sp.]